MNTDEGEVKRTVCCACHQQCGLLVQVNDNQVVSIRGDKQHPGSAGFACTKGRRAHELHTHSKRVHQPLKRSGPRGSGEWQEISWSEAIDEIAESIKGLTETYGKESLAYSFGTFHGADWGIGQRFMNLFGSPNTAGQDKICYGPGALGETLTYGYGPSFFSFPVPGKTRCMVVWGLRPSASMPLLWRQILRAKRAGAKLIVVDPERVQEVNQADLWLQTRPGTDTALALALIHNIINESAYDKNFVHEHTTGFTDLEKHAASFTAEHAEALTGVSAELIKQAASMLSQQSPAIIHAGNGLCQTGKGSVQTGRALACLIAITGNLGIEGGHNLTGPPQDIIANGDAFAASSLTREQRAKRLGAESFSILGEAYDELDDVLSEVWYGKRHIMNWLDSAHEPTLWPAILEQEPYPVKALILQHHNPVGASPNSATVAEALRHSNLELLVAQDLFLNASSSLADYVLPASHWLEKSFMSMGLGLLGFANNYVECKQAVLEPEHQHHSDYDLWRDLAERLSHMDNWPNTLEEFWDSCLQPAGLDFDAVCQRTGPLFGDDARAQNSSSTSSGNSHNKIYATPSGKIELRSSLLESWGENSLPTFEQPDIIETNKDDYPLVLTTGGRVIEGLHQDAQQMPWFRRKYPEPLVSLHPETAGQADISEGDWVWIETPLERVRQRARLTSDLQQDVVHADRWWYPEQEHDHDDPFGWRTTNINVCTDGSIENCDSILGSWLLRGLPCRLVKALD